MDLAVVFLDVSWQLFEKISASVKKLITLIMRTGDFFKIFDFVNDVVVQTGLAE